MKRGRRDDEDLGGVQSDRKTGQRRNSAHRRGEAACADSFGSR